jgi:CRP-like cAMP-binding protein
VELIEFDADALRTKSETDIELLRMRTHFLELLLMDAARRLESFVRDSPEDRYLELINSKQELVSRIPDKYIASYIGVTPVTLSRIRSRLHRE